MPSHTVLHFITLLFFILITAACGKSVADPSQKHTLGALTPGELLWYDGTEVGTPLTINSPKEILNIQASSTLKPGTASGTRYDKKNLLDRNPATAWCEGEKGSGVGERITIRFAGEPVPAAMEIIPGYAKNEKVWQHNPRVARVRIQFLRSKDALQELKAAGETPYKREFFAELKSTDGRIPYAKRQYFDFRPDFTQDMTMLDFDGLQIEVTAVEGESAKFQDTCISELQFFTWE